MAKTNSAGPGAPARLENRLVLLGWLHGQLGYESTAELLEDARKAEEGFPPDRPSHICSRLASRPASGRLSHDIRAKLPEYDANIRKHLDAVNEDRDEWIGLKYFQYLAALYAEIFLDHYFNRRRALLESLNGWVARRNGEAPHGRPHREFRETDLKKLAFWMATGSGKTLVMHINYRQFLDYNNGQLDNILLVTPNEGLSRQHLEELRKANIPAAMFNARGARPETGSGTVRIMEITKFESEKRGEGSSVPVGEFEGDNLVFVDEGHRGSGGQKWKEVRDELGKGGFTFEYSATFGQALAAARDDGLTEEYGRAIAFDYHYRHFYNDGYGKDFRLVNLRRETAGGQTDTLLLANLLTFYEQHLIFAEHGGELRRYNVERPLWVFIGRSVQSDKQMRSDILYVTLFLHRLLSDSGWATETIGRLLEGKSGLRDDEGRDIVRDMFRYLRDRQPDAVSVYADILKRVLHADHAGGLHICDIAGSGGELGLKAADSQRYFGLINIGDTGGFKKLVESHGAGIAIEGDSHTASLFDGINEPNTVEILIGARKFIEGWNSWRVSAMGLLNLGRREGSQIIQMFGRGVRLRGLDGSLKRSSGLAGTPGYVRHLETLNIFALRADYMVQFRDYLESEGAPVHGMVEVQLPIRPNHDLLARGLMVPRLPEGASFADEPLMLKADPSISVAVDLSARVDLMASGPGGLAEASTAPPTGQKIRGSLDLVDMADIYVRLLERKEASKWYNMAVSPDAPETILKKGRYEIAADGSVLNPRSFEGVRHLQDAAAAVVIKYAEQFYRTRREAWAHGRVAYRKLSKGDPNFQDYSVSIPADMKDLVSKIRQLVECNRIYRGATDDLPNVHFDRHLYLPLLLADKRGVTIRPPGLNRGEAEFVRDLRDYCAHERDRALAGMEIFLLRNQGRGRGIGFFETSGFYPDFILWVKSRGMQSVVFVEPHGMFYGDPPEDNEKVNLHRKMRELTERIRQRPDSDAVTLDSYIVSQTPFEVLTNLWGKDWNRRRLAEHHILFPERGGGYDYVAEIVQGTGS